MLGCCRSEPWTSWVSAVTICFFQIVDRLSFSETPNQLSTRAKAFILPNSQITSERTARLEIKSGKMLILLRTMESGTGRWMPQQPQPVEFANMFEQLFAGNLGMPIVQPYLTEAPWTMAELKKAVARLKANKAADGC